MMSQLQILLIICHRETGLVLTVYLPYAFFGGFLELLSDVSY